MKLGNIIKIQRVFMAIRKEKISPILSYKIFKLLTQIEQNQIKFFNEQYKEIAKKYAEKLFHNLPQLNLCSKLTKYENSSPQLLKTISHLSLKQKMQ